MYGWVCDVGAGGSIDSRNASEGWGERGGYLMDVCDVAAGGCKDRNTSEGQGQTVQYCMVVCGAAAGGYIDRNASEGWRERGEDT